MTGSQEPWFLKSTYPVLFPHHSALTLPSDEFDNFLKTEIGQRQSMEEDKQDSAGISTDDGFTLICAGQSTTAETRAVMEGMGIAEIPSIETKTKDDEAQAHPFMKGLTSYDEMEPPEWPDMENKMFTANRDLAHRSTGSPLLDLFSSLETTVSGPHLFELLTAAWAEDPILTLKVIFNARSIHLGKSDRVTFYRCAGWLAQYHPLTLISNLRWLSRPVIEKKVERKEEEEDIVFVEEEKDEGDTTRFDVKHGASHGYWKDLLNILALSANDYLTVLANPLDILNIENKRESNGASKNKKLDKDAAKTKRYEIRNQRHHKAVERFESDAVHRALHIAIARLFAEQLNADLELLHSDDPKAKKHISLCGKWAPSHDRFHDRHTFLVSSIAELLQPMAGEMDRETYLRHARESYRKKVSSLREHLDVVERKLSAKSLETIKYDRIPSIAMKNYAPIFEEKDGDRFRQYMLDVAKGTKKISGATLLPSTLVSTMRGVIPLHRHDPNSEWSALDKDVVKAMSVQVADAQWKTLVQRIKDSGAIESSIAVCDVSGSMLTPVFRDRTCPLDSSIGLSLLVAEVTAPPFGGSFITFSQKPKVKTFDVALPLSDKYRVLASNQDWGMNTNFVSVFEDLILPMAERNKLKPDDMVKRIFVFSDMQFDEAERKSERWSTAFERIKKKFAAAGYEMPQLVFWNLAGGRAGYPYTTTGDPIMPKPVTVQDDGTAIVSGYSQGMLKMFLDNGSFEDPEEKAEENVETGVSGEKEDAEESGSPAKKRKINPLSTVKKAVQHKAYDMLKVLD